MIIKKSIVFMICLGLFLASQLQAQNKVILYVGTFTGTGAEGIYICSFDTLTGDIVLENTFRGLENPNYLVKSDNGNFLYVCLRPKQKSEDESGVVASFQIDKKNGELKFLNEQSSCGIDPCYVDVSPDGQFIAVANYGNGSITLYKTGQDGRIGNPLQVIQHKGNGPNKERQAGPHAHSVRFSHFTDQVFAADLGIDKLKIYRIDESLGRLSQNNIPFVDVKPGSGPRHFDFSPDSNIIYLVNELGSTVSVIDMRKNFMIVQDIKTIPQSFKEENYCADIHLSKDGKFLYCSNRGHNSITTFKIKNDGTLKRKATTSTLGNWPRNFTLTPGGFILVANQNSNNITVFTISKKSGIPVFTGKEIKIPSPVCLVF